MFCVTFSKNNNLKYCHLVSRQGLTCCRQGLPWRDCRTGPSTPGSSGTCRAHNVLDPAWRRSGPDTADVSSQPRPSRSRIYKSVPDTCRGPSSWRGTPWCSIRLGTRPTRSSCHCTAAPTSAEQTHISTLLIRYYLVELLYYKLKVRACRAIFQKDHNV